MNATTTTATVDAEVTILHEDGTDTISDFAHLEEEHSSHTINLHVWDDEHTGDADIVYYTASVLSITPNVTVDTDTEASD